MNNELNLSQLKLKTFTEQDTSDYCLLNNLNPSNIILLDLSINELTDISGIRLFKNLEILWLDYNFIKDISVIQYLKNLKELSIQNLELKSDQIRYINSLKNLETLFYINGFKNMSFIDKLNDIKILKLK